MIRKKPKRGKASASKSLIKDIKKYKLRPNEHLIILLDESGSEFYIVKEEELRKNDYKFDLNGVSYYVVPTKKKHVFVKGDFRELDESKLVKILTEKNIVDPFLFKKTRPLIISEALSKTLGVESPMSKYARANLLISLVGFLVLIGVAVLSWSQIQTLKHNTQILSHEVQTLEKMTALKNINQVQPSPSPHQPENNQNGTKQLIIPPENGGGGG